MSYTINFTDKTKTPIIVADDTVDRSTDISLFGRTELMYGQELQENLLHILENFACPEDPENPGNPDLSKAVENIFVNVIEGQGWYNSTQEKVYFYDGSVWVPLSRVDDVAGNSGTISHGQYLPKPISYATGSVFDYPECIWLVSPMNFPSEIDYLICEADDTGLVTSQYKLQGVDLLIDGIANYTIIGIRGNVNQPEPSFIASPTPTPTPTVTPTLSIGASPTPAATQTRTPAASHTPSPTPASTHTRTPTPTVTPSKSVPALGPLPIQGQSFSATDANTAYCGGSNPHDGNASVGFVFNPNGTFSVTPQSVHRLPDPPTYGTWLPSGQSASDWQIKFVSVLSQIGSQPCSETNSAAAFQTLTATQVYSLSGFVKCGSAADQGTECSLTISLKQTSTGQLVNTTCSVTVQAISQV